MLFTDREEAGNRLAAALERYQGTNPLVLAIPRGALPIGKIIADRLSGDLDVILVHKVGAPGNPEYAIGAATESGQIFPSEVIGLNGYSQMELEAEAVPVIKTLQKRRKLYSGFHEPLDPRNRIVIIVDDGIATGNTMLAAIKSVREHDPGKVIVAAPVVSVHAAEALRIAADETTFLDVPDDFFAISQFYEDFGEVSDEKAAAILRQSLQRKPTQAA